MRILFGISLVTVAALAVATVRADDVQSGPTDKIGGAFNVKAITGEHRVGDKKEELCYVCKYNAQARPAVVLIFTQKADENLAAVVKAIDEVQKSNKDLG